MKNSIMSTELENKPLDGNGTKLPVSGSPKLTFGLTLKNIEVIKKNINRWEGAEYDRDTWIRVGEEIGWEPLTACLWWFRKDCP